LGDNIFYGHDLNDLLLNAMQNDDGGTIFAYHVQDPEKYGVVEFNRNKNVVSLEEKPKNSKSNYAITGLYLYDRDVVKMAKTLKPLARGEFEITDLNQLYVDQQKLQVEIMSRDYAWFDTGTHESLLNTSRFIVKIENRQGLKLVRPEEIIFTQVWIVDSQLERLAVPFLKNQYGQYLHQDLKAKSNK
jgi:glucose-1-phosphate thymidylyltransferase